MKYVFENEAEWSKGKTDAQVRKIIEGKFLIAEGIQKSRKLQEFLLKNPRWYVDAHQINQKTLICEDCSASMIEIHAGKLECSGKKGEIKMKKVV